MQLYTKFTNAVPLGVKQIITVVGPLTSPEAQEVLDNMPVALGGTEELATIAFVNSQSLSLGSGNWPLIEVFAHGKLSNNTNKLHKWIANSPMINNGAILDPTGWIFNGTTAFIDSGYNPTFRKLDNFSGSFVVSENGSGFSYAFGNQSGANNGTQIFTVGTQLRYLNFNTVQIVSTGTWAANTLYQVTRTDANTISAYINGSLEITNNAKAVTPDVTVDLYLGAINDDNAASGFFDGTLSSFIAGAAVGFDNLNFYNNLVILNAAL